MIFTVETAQYVYNVTTALASGKTLPQMTNVCPECNDRLGFFNTGEHVVFDTNPEDRGSIDALVIIVACEGYWMIDPNLVGIPSEGWMRINDMIEGDRLTKRIDADIAYNLGMSTDANVADHPTDDPDFNGKL
jgi:hypothetical protein